MKLTPVTNENIHDILPKYIEDRDININDIDNMIDTYMNMVKDGYLFMIDRDLLRDLLVDITYIYCPNDDVNKSRVLEHLIGDSDSDDSDDEECSDEIKMEEISTNTD
jgi:hypothetical protein